MDSSRAPGEVVTFYSYKGGTGRSMSLANVACLLAAKLPASERVLVVDWDLEAPGLHRYFSMPGSESVENPDEQPGLIELFETLDLHIGKGDPADAHASANEAIEKIPLPDFFMATGAAGVDLLRAGRFDDGYPRRVAAFDWMGLFGRNPQVFSQLARRLARDYRYVLIDARTGNSDTSGICTTLMPEKLVVVFTPNRQSLDGITRLVTRAVAYRRGSDDLRPLLVYPLASRIDSTRESLRADWRHGNPTKGIEGFQPLFEATLKHAYGLESCNLEAYFKDVQIMHSPDHAFGEEIAALSPESTSDDLFSIKRGFENLLRWVEPSVLPWETPEIASQRLALVDAETELKSLGQLPERDKKLRKRQAELLRLVLDLNTRLLGPMHADTVAATNGLAEFLFANGELASARTLFEETLAKTRELFGDEHPGTVVAMNNLAVAHRTLGDLAEARALNQQVLDLERRLLGPEHPNTLTAMNNLAATLFALGDLDGAQELEESVYTVRKRLLGSEHPDTLASMHNLAGTLYARGDLARARSMQEEVLGIRRRVLGEVHADTLTSMNGLAAILGKQGELAASQDLFAETLAILQRDRGEDHPETLSVMSNLASMLRVRGKLEEARELQEKTLAIRKRVLGEEHPDTITSMSNLAGTLRDLRDLRAASALGEQALSLSRRLLGDEHPQTLASMQSLARTLHAAGDDPGATKLLLSTLATQARVLGEDHPDTLTTRNHLARSLLAHDRAAARELEERTLEARMRVLGPEHPDTLESMVSLAAILRMDKDLEAARSLAEKATLLRREVLGEAHPATLAAMNSLADIMVDCGQTDDAIALLATVIEKRAQLLGPTHPDTIHVLTSAVNLVHKTRDREHLRIVATELLRITEKSESRLAADNAPLLKMLAAMSGLAEDLGDEKLASRLERIVSARLRASR
jgi:tetratricopeptide (TPR) repeat protein/cellulose biosynthesis protein BcsQ